MPSQPPIEIVNVGFLPSGEHGVAEFRLDKLRLKAPSLRKEGDTGGQSQSEQGAQDGDLRCSPEKFVARQHPSVIHHADNDSGHENSLEGQENPGIGGLKDGLPGSSLRFPCWIIELIIDSNSLLKLLRAHHDSVGHCSSSQCSETCS